MSHAMPTLIQVAYLAATVLFILEQLRRDNTPLPCVALGFGPGITIEAALIR